MPKRNSGQLPPSPSSVPQPPNNVKTQISNTGGWYNWWGYDLTEDRDKAERKWHEPQVQDGWRSYALWTHRTDGLKQSLYLLRQILAFPQTIIGLLRLPAWCFIGMAIRHSITALWFSLGYWSIIPACIILLPLICGFLMVNFFKDMLLPSSLKLFFIGLGFAL